MFSPAIGDGSWPSYLAAGVRANDAAVILNAQKLASWQLREDLTDLKRDDCKSAYGIDSGRTSYQLLAVQAVLLGGHRRSSDERNWTTSQVLPDRADRRGLFEPRLRRSAHHPPVRPRSRHPQRTTPR